MFHPKILSLGLFLRLFLGLFLGPFLGALLGALLGAVPAASAGDPAPKAPLSVYSPGNLQFGTEVDAIKLKGLRPLVGKFLHVFYVSAREAAVGLEGTELIVYTVLKEPLRIEVPASGEIDLPAVRVPTKNFKRFNHLLIAVTGAEPAQLFLKNVKADALIEDPRIKTPQDLENKPDRDFQVEAKHFISAIRLGQLKPAAGPTPVELKDLH